MFSSSCVQPGFWLSSFMSGKAIFLLVSKAKATLPVQRRAVPHLFYLPWWKLAGFSLTPPLLSCCLGRWPFGSPVCDSCELSQELSHTGPGVQSFGVLLLNLLFPAGNPSAARCLSFLPYSGIIGGVLLLPLEKACCPPSFGHFRANLGSGFCYKSLTQWACGLILHVALSDHWLFPSINLLGPEAELCFCFLCSSVLSKLDCRWRHFLPVAFLFSLHPSCFPLLVIVCILWYVLSQRCYDARAKIFGGGDGFYVWEQLFWRAIRLAWATVCSTGQ